MSSTIPGAMFGNPKWLPTLYGNTGTGLVTQAGTAGRVFLTPFWLARAVIVSRIGCQVTTVGGVGTFLRLGLYRDVEGTPATGALIVDSGNIAADVLGIRTFTFTNPVFLEAGIVWGALETQDAIVVFNRYSGQPGFAEVGSERLSGGRYDRGGGFGALTDPCPAVTSDAATNFLTRLRIDTIA